MTRTAAILARISDADDTTGVDDQVRRMLAFCSTNDLTVREDHILIENDTSAYKVNKRTGRTNRPKFRKANELLRTRAVDVLVVLDIDRLARQPRDLEDTIDIVITSGFAVTCVSLTGSCQLTDLNGIAIARILCAVANKSSADTARRVSAARERQALAGQFGGGRRPYGFESDGVTPIPEEIKVVRRMADVALLATFGQPDGPSLASITRELQTDGIRTADGGQWTAHGVRDVLMRPRNAALTVSRPGTGRKVYGPADVVGALPFEPIVSAEELWIIIGKLADPDRRTNRAGVAPKWLGSGVYRCPCGSVVRVSGSSQKRDRPVYACPVRGEGTHASCPQADLDALVEGVAVVWLATYASDYIKPAPGVDVGALRAEKGRLKTRIQMINDERDDDPNPDDAEYRRRIKRLTDKITIIDQRLADVAEQSSPVAEFAGVENEADALRVWQGLGVTRQREIVKAIMTVSLKPTGRGWRGTIDQRVSIEPIMPVAA